MPRSSRRRREGLELGARQHLREEAPAQAQPRQQLSPRGVRGERSQGLLGRDDGTVEVARAGAHLGAGERHGGVVRAARRRPGQAPVRLGRPSFRGEQTGHHQIEPLALFRGWRARRVGLDRLEQLPGAGELALEGEARLRRAQGGAGVMWLRVQDMRLLSQGGLRVAVGQEEVTERGPSPEQRWNGSRRRLQLSSRARAIALAQGQVAGEGPGQGGASPAPTLDGAPDPLARSPSRRSER